MLLVLAALAPACKNGGTTTTTTDTTTTETPTTKEGAPVGSLATDFSVGDEAGHTVKLSDLRGKQPVLLAFYPKDFTQG
jgi:hypothetical protein